MSTMTIEQILHAVEQLTPEEQDRLITILRRKRAEQQIVQQPQTAPQPEPGEPIEDEWAFRRGAEFVDYYRSPTRAELIEELESQRAVGAFGRVESLYGKFANPDAPDLSAEGLHAQLHDIATEWEQELDEFNPDNA